MGHIHTKDVRFSASREAILGHLSGTKFCDLGLVQSRHDYDPQVLEVIRQKAIALKQEDTVREHLNLTFASGIQRKIPEIRELQADKHRLERLSDLAGTKLENYYLDVVSTTVTFMSPMDGSVDWHCDGVPGTELIPLSISDPIIGGELEIYRGNCEVGKALTQRGDDIDPGETLKVPHMMGYSTLGQFHGVYHRTNPIQFGERITLVMNLRSVDEPWIDSNDVTYLLADNHGAEDQSWIDDMIKDDHEVKLPSYQRHMEQLGTEAA